MSKFLSVCKFTSALSGGLLAAYALYTKVGELNEAAREMDEDFGISETAHEFMNSFVATRKKIAEVPNA